MSGLLDYPALVFIVAFVVLWSATQVGAIWLRKERALEAEHDGHYGMIVGATLTLLSLIIGFSFSMAVGRYDQRKQAEAVEANTIGTEFLRAQLLPEADATKVRALLKRYLDELLIQARLGKMETEAAYLRERETLEAKITAARHCLEQIRHSAVEEFADAAHAVSQKMTLLALNFGAAGVLAQESLADTKSKVKERLATLSGTLQAEGELAGEKAHQAAQESREALDGILSNLRSLVGK
jgi:hypothetical protein